MKLKTKLENCEIFFSPINFIHNLIHKVYKQQEINEQVIIIKNNLKKCQESQVDKKSKGIKHLKVGAVSRFS